MNKYLKFLVISSLLFTKGLYAQSVSSAPIEMADKMMQDGKIYVVVTVLSIVFVCIISYLILLDRRLMKLEKNK